MTLTNLYRESGLPFRVVQTDRMLCWVWQIERYSDDSRIDLGDMLADDGRVHDGN